MIPTGLFIEDLHVIPPEVPPAICVEISFEIHKKSAEEHRGEVLAKLLVGIPEKIQNSRRHMSWVNCESSKTICKKIITGENIHHFNRHLLKKFGRSS